ncbi:MAG: biotin/lipoyl-binding protein [Pseudonocardiaceae bacterium]
MHAIDQVKRPRRSAAPRGRRRWAVGSVVVAVALGLGLAGIVATSGNGEPSYRTASVERADVDATLDSLGTIQPLNQANLSFPVSGNVESVSATVGQHVTVGQTVAQLNTVSLDAQVAAANSAVAAAQARLTADESSQTGSTVTATVAATAFSAVITSGDDARSARAATSDPASAARDLVTTEQATLLADQHRADQDLAHEKGDLTTETNLCQTFLTSADTSTPRKVSIPPGQRSGSSREFGPAATTSPPRASKSTFAATQEGTTTPAIPDASACRSAIATVLADQVAVDHDQQAVTADLPTLSAAVDKLMAAAPAGGQPQHLQIQQSVQSPQPQRSPQPQPVAKAASAAGRADRSAQVNAPSAGGANRTAAVPRPPSAEQLASDQAAIDAAQAQLTEVQQEHDQAELRSPIDGTVGSVTISAGQSVQGSSSTPQIVIVGRAPTRS